MQRRFTDNELLFFAYRGPAEVVRHVVRQSSVDLDTRSPKGWTPLMLATERRHYAIAKILVDAGADYNAANEKFGGMTALHIASRNQDSAITRLLMKAGATVDAVAAGSTSLHIASYVGCPSVMQTLLKAGANPDIRQLQDGATPMFLAAKPGHLEAVQLLLSKKADPLIANDQNYTPLEIAVEDGHVSIVRELVEVAGVRAFGRSFALAAQKGHVGMMQLLYAAGARDATGQALRGAILKCAGETVVDFLLRRPEPIGEANSPVPHRSASFRYVNYRGSGDTPPALLCCLSTPTASSHRVLRMLIDAGARTTFPITLVNKNDQVVLETRPLEMLTETILNREFNGTKLNDESISWVNEMRRQLLQIEAIRAVSWGWPSSPPSTSAASSEGSSTPSAPLAPMPKYRAAKNTRAVMRALLR